MEKEEGICPEIVTAIKNVEEAIQKAQNMMNEHTHPLTIRKYQKRIIRLTEEHENLKKQYSTQVQEQFKSERIIWPPGCFQVPNKYDLCPQQDECVAEPPFDTEPQPLIVYPIDNTYKIICPYCVCYHEGLLTGKEYYPSASMPEMLEKHEWEKFRQIHFPNL